MQTLNSTIDSRRAIRLRPWIGGLLVLLCLLLPVTAMASPSDPSYQEPDKCAECHPVEAATWRDSRHAGALIAVEALLETACVDVSLEDCECLTCHTTHYEPEEGSYTHDGVTCEACHGAYVPDHPQSGVMQLPVDGSCCQTCHTNTYQQWHDTAHAGANVQCVGCHVPHTQETRLIDEALCGSCHRKEGSDWAHHNAGVTCTDCHLPTPSVSDVTAEIRVIGGAAAPNHSFEVAVGSCVKCHQQHTHQQVFEEATDQVDRAQVSDMTERARELAYELEDAKRTTRSLQAMSVVSLGFGLGVGGVLGGIFVLVVGYVSQGRARR